jgi:hypothetical protein
MAEGIGGEAAHTEVSAREEEGGNSESACISFMKLAARRTERARLTFTILPFSDFSRIRDQSSLVKRYKSQ